MIVFTLHRYIFTELLKIFLLTTVALTLILSLGSTIEPIQRYGVGPGQVAAVLGYFIPITLTFVLPIAGMFASSLVYGRLANDNELSACRASGISLLTVIYPGICLAFIIAIATLTLSFYIVPNFVHRAEKTIKDNAKQILFRNIQRKGYYTLPGNRFTIHADYAVPKDDLLFGVIITEATEKQKAMSRLITADSAKIVIKNQRFTNKVTVTAANVHQIDDQGVQSDFSVLDVSAEFPPMLGDKIKFQEIEQIKKIQANMMNFMPIRKFAINTGAQIGMELLNEELLETLNNSEDNYYQLSSENRIIMLKTGNSYAEKDHEIRLEGPISVVEFERKTQRPICSYQSSEGFIKLNSPQIDSRLVMVLKDAQWQLPDGIKSVAPTPKRSFHDLYLPEPIRAKLSEESLLYTIQNMEDLFKKKPSRTLLRQRSALVHEIDDVNEDIASEKHSRLVLGIGCIILTLLSIAYGILLKGGHLLTAFGVSVVPAAVLIIFIMAGKNLITAGSELPITTGIAVMWSCVVMLLCVALFTYRKLMRT